MSEFNAQAQMIELTDDQLELVEGGRSELANTIVSFIPYVGAINTLSGAAGVPTFGDLF